METIADAIGLVKGVLTPIASEQAAGNSHKKGAGELAGDNTETCGLILDKLGLYARINEAYLFKSIRTNLMDKAVALAAIRIEHLHNPIGTRRVTFLLPIPGTEEPISKDQAKPGKKKGAFLKKKAKPTQAYVQIECDKVVDGEPVGHTVHFRIEYNPAKWDEHIDYLFSALRRILYLDEFSPPPGSPHLRLHHVLRTATVTRVHVAKDYLGVDMNRVVWDSTKDDRRRPVLTDEHGLETLYIGAFKSADAEKGNSFCLYEKSIEAGLPGPMMRVEARRNNPRLGGHPLRLKDIHQMANPFLELRCSDPMAGMNAVNYPPIVHRPVYLANFVAYGQKAGFKLLARGMNLATVGDLSAQHKVKERLKETEAKLLAAVPTFWNPVETWKGWPEAVRRALPGITPEHAVSSAGAVQQKFAA